MLEPLNLQKIFVNYFAGGMEVFMWLAIVIIAFFCAKFKVPTSVMGILLIIFTVIMLPFYPSPIAFIMFVIGIMLVYVLTRGGFR